VQNGAAVQPFCEAERTIGLWNDTQVVHDGNLWMVIVNKRMVSKAECSIAGTYPFWLSGSAGFEIRNIEIMPLSPK